SRTPFLQDPARIRCGKELYPKHTENMNKLFSIKSTRGSQRSTGNVDQVCFWGIATPVTRKRDPTMTLHRSSGGVTLSKCPNSRQRFQRWAAFLWIDPGPPLRFHPGLNLSDPA